MTMKALLTGIETSLKNSATLSYIADANVFITPDEDIIPMTATFPALGLKDGQIAREMVSSAPGGKHLWDIKYHVHVIIYVNMTAGETPVIGQAAPATVIKGTLDIAPDVATVLHENYQSVAGVIDAACFAESESEIIGGTDTIVLKKRLTFEYHAQEVL
jgi:hypothetical protein